MPLKAVHCYEKLYYLFLCLNSPVLDPPSTGIVTKYCRGVEFNAWCGRTCETESEHRQCICRSCFRSSRSKVTDPGRMRRSPSRRDNFPWDTQMASLDDHYRNPPRFLIPSSTPHRPASSCINRQLDRLIAHDSRSSSHVPRGV